MAGGRYGKKLKITFFKSVDTDNYPNECLSVVPFKSGQTDFVLE